MDEIVPGARVDRTDADLVRAAKGGVREAYEELVRRWSRRVYAICWSRTGRREDAAELAQESLLRGFRALASLADDEKFGSWLCGIAARACLDWLKDRERSQVSLDALVPDGRADDLLPGRLPDSSGSLEDEERRRRIREEVARLPEIFREVVTMFYLENRDYRQITAALGIGPQAVNARLHKARELLRTRLKGVASEDETR